MPVADLEAIGQRATGRRVTLARPIGAGRNSRVFRLDLEPGAPGEPGSVVVKFYRRDPGDTRDRLAAEHGALTFLWNHGLRAVARPLACDHEAYCAVYEDLVGEVPAAATATLAEIDATVAFLARLKELRSEPGAELLPVASEACFSLGELAANIESRYQRLAVSPRDGDRRALHEWLDATFVPLRSQLLAWAEARSGGVWLDASHRTLSPSDIGFHNMIRRPGGALAFVDFEYFGWDDPAKMLVDFVLHPGMDLAAAHRARYSAGLLSVFADESGLRARAETVYPLFGLKWCLIVLNEFLPGRSSVPQAAGVTAAAAHESRALQLAKADGIAHRIRHEYRENPYLKS